MITSDMATTAYDSAVFLGNSATNSAQQLESSVRLGGMKLSIDCLYSKFIHPTSNKDALRIMPPDVTHGSEYVWITRGHFLGPVEMCWNSDESHPATGRFQVLENSLLVPNDSAPSNACLNVGGSGGASYEDVTIRNCVFHYAGGTGKVNAPIATGCQQPSTRLTVIDNTMVLVGHAGAADLLYADANCDNFRLERNIFFSSSDGKAYFFKPQAKIVAANNVWYTSAAVVDVAGEGKLTLAKWNDRAGTASDYFQSGMTAASFAAPFFVPPEAMSVINGPYKAPAGAAAEDYNGKPRTGRAGAADVSIGPASGRVNEKE